MIKRTISVGKASRISLSKEQLVFWFPKEEKESRIPVEDIGVFVLDHFQITITQAAMNALLSNNAAILWCDEKHLPNGLVLNMNQNHVFAEKVKVQIDASIPLKKRLWKQNIQGKIRNQAAVLDYLKKPCSKLKEFADEVKSGDSTNIEARAARLYWKELFSEIEHFERGQFGDSPNNLLNYGYAIIRSLLARALVSSGCMPALGIFHRNKYNAFCLADDMMESYRPYVDILVMDIIRESGELPEELRKEHKAALLQLSAMDVNIGNMTSPLMIATQRTSASLMQCFEKKGKN